MITHARACPPQVMHACSFVFSWFLLMLWIFCSEGTQVPPLSGLSRKLDERAMPFSQLHTFQGVHVCFWLSGLPKKLGTEMPLWPRVSVLENATALKCLCALHATSGFWKSNFFCFHVQAKCCQRWPGTQEVSEGWPCFKRGHHMAPAANQKQWWRNGNQELAFDASSQSCPGPSKLPDVFCVILGKYFFDIQGHSNDSQWPQRCSGVYKWHVLEQFERVPWLAKTCRSCRCFGFQPLWWWGSNFWPCRTLVFELGQWNHPIAYQQSLQPLSHWTGTFKYVLEIGKQYKHHFARTASASNWKFPNSWDVWMWRPPWTTHCMQRRLEISCAVPAPGPTAF